MITAYLLIVSDPGCERHVVSELVSIDEVREASIVYGDYDLVARVDIEEISDLTDFILEKIHTIVGIRRTSTLIVAE